jgi:hypothetical protein
VRVEELDRLDEVTIAAARERTPVGANGDEEEDA